MTQQQAQFKVTAFPKWLGLGWIFLVWLEVGYDWQRLASFGIAPAFIAWLVWDFVARTTYVQRMSEDSIENVWKWFGRGIWGAAILVGGATFYANHYMPKGPMIYTGEEVCDDRGRCGERRVEDTRRLAVPVWVKILKDETYSIGGLLILVVGAAFVSGRPRGGYRKEGT